MLPPAGDSLARHAARRCRATAHRRATYRCRWTAARARLPRPLVDLVHRTQAGRKGELVRRSIFVAKQWGEYDERPQYSRCAELRSFGNGRNPVCQRVQNLESEGDTLGAQAVGIRLDHRYDGNAGTLSRRLRVPHDGIEIDFHPRAVYAFV